MKKLIAHIVYIAIIALLGWQMYTASTQLTTATESARSAEKRSEQSEKEAGYFRNLFLGLENEHYGDAESAIGLYKNAIGIINETTQEDPVAYLRLAQVQFDTGRFEEAEKSGESFLELSKNSKKDGVPTPDRISNNQSREEKLLDKIQRELGRGRITRDDSSKLFIENCSYSSEGTFFFIDGSVVLARNTELPLGTVLCVDGRESRVVRNGVALLYPGHTENYPVLDGSFSFTRASIGNCTEGVTFNEIHSLEDLPDNVRIKIEEASSTAFIDDIKKRFGKHSVIGGIKGDRNDIFKGLNKYLTEITNDSRKPDYHIHIDVYERDGYAYGLVSVNYEDTINFEEGDLRSSKIPEGNVSRKVLLAVGFGDFRYHKDEAGNYVTDDVEIDRVELAWDREVQNRLGNDITYRKSTPIVSDLDGDANPEFYYTSSHYESHGGHMVEIDLKSGNAIHAASWGCGS